MSTSVAIASASLAVAASNSQSIKAMECKNFISIFNNSSSTISDKQYYSECINLIYPRSMDYMEIFFLKFLFVLAIVGLAIGLYKAYRERYSDSLDYIYYAVCGFLILPSIAVIIALLVNGFIWLFK